MYVIVVFHSKIKYIKNAIPILATPYPCFANNNKCIKSNDVIIKINFVTLLSIPFLKCKQYANIKKLIAVV
jgi:hypothetical protein